MVEKRSGGKFWRFAVKAAISLVLLWIPLRHVAVGAVFAQIAIIDRAGLILALFALAFASFVAALRWSTILSALLTPRSLSITYPLSLIGIFFGQALPAGIGGDVVRAWLARRTGMTTRVAISSIVGDRLTGFLAILIIVTAELPQLDRLLTSRALFYGLLVVLACGYGGIAAVMYLDKLPALLHRFRVVQHLAGISADLRTAIFSPAGIVVLLLGAIVQLCNVVAVFALTLGLHLPASFTSCLLIVPFANVLQTVPISVAGWGVRESFFVAAFGMIGVAAPSALAVSVIFGLLVLVNSLPGGVLWLMQGSPTTAKLPDAL
jgi:glycosyltransferase 2 family protein